MGKLKRWLNKGKYICRIMLEKVTGMKLRYRMMILYFAGGALPSIVIGMYLINGTNRILEEEAKSTEITELEMVRQQTQELLATVRMVSRYFIFDEKLENIALKEYTDYQEMVDDYRDYTAFVQYGSYYNNIISWISVCMENESIRGNAHFVKADDTIREQNWYVKAKEKMGGIVWQYLPENVGGSHGLALTRLIRTKKNEEVGVLVLYIRPERLKEIIDTRDHDTMMILNGDTLVADRTGNVIDLKEIKGAIPQKDNKTHQKEVVVDNKEYVMTCANIELYDSGDYIQIVSLRSLKEILKSAERQNRHSIIIFMFSVGVSVIMICVFSWSFGKRVSCFHSQMQRAAAGEFDLVETLGGKDEISELYDYLGTMIQEIRRLLSEVYRERLRAEKLKSEQRNAEFKMLASQINPHFLYNTLETIRMKARVNGQPDIERLIKMLAKILRQNIRAGSQDVALQTEINLVECYLEIQKYRFGSRIQYAIHMEDKLKQYQVFPLLLQPIVENSIIHGLEIKEGIGHIDIQVAEKNQEVHITVSDDGMGMDEAALKSLVQSMDQESQDNAHIGVGNVHRRIRLRYGDKYGLKITSESGVGTVVAILLPLDGLDADEENKERCSGGKSENVQSDGNR